MRVLVFLIPVAVFALYVRIAIPVWDWASQDYRLSRFIWLMAYQTFGALVVIASGLLASGVYQGVKP